MRDTTLIKTKCPQCGGERTVQKHHLIKVIKHKIRCRSCVNRDTNRKKRRKTYQRYFTTAGYCRIFLGKGEPMTDCRGEAYEHRLVMAKKLGRPLKRFEHIHHKNGDKADNRLENLELINPQKHQIFTKLETYIKHLESILIKHSIPF